MSNFAEACATHAASAWRAVGSFPEKYSKWKKEPSTGQKAQRGCLGFLIFGIAYIFVPMIMFLFIEAVLVAYALLVSLLWGVTAGISVIMGRRNQGHES